MVSVPRNCRLSTLFRKCDSLLTITDSFPRREDVETANRQRMTSIRGVQEHVFTASDGGSLYSMEQGKKLLSNFMAPEVLKLKVGAQVRTHHPLR